MEEPVSFPVPYANNYSNPTTRPLVDNDAAYNAMTTYYNDNQAILQSAEYSGANGKKELNVYITTFHEVSKVVVDTLEMISAFHPIIRACVVAFRTILELDIRRKENNEKILILRVLMQDMMCSLFQLRNIRCLKEKGPDGTTIQDRLNRDIQYIEKDIKACGSACEVYTQKHFLARMIRSKTYEERLAEWGHKFATHKANILSHVQMYVALGVSHVQEKLDTIHEEIKEIGSDIKSVIALFHQIRSNEEKEITKYIVDNGGASAVVNSRVKLTKLMEWSGDSNQDLLNLGNDSKAKDEEQRFKSTQIDLLRELAQNVETLFEQNRDSFNVRLDMLHRDMLHENTLVMRQLSAGSHDRISDLDLRTIWREMGWKGGVKGRNFVIALKDYFSDKEAFVGPGALMQTTPPVDMWTLDHINVSNLQPLLEAIDDDATGFVSVGEVNVFSQDRPQHWSIAQWLAYWAAGHHFNVTKYRSDIYDILRSMNYAARDSRRENRRHVDSMLDSSGMNQLELILRGTRSYSRGTGVELRRLAEKYREQELTRLENKLIQVRFQLDDPATVGIITGKGRIEKHFWPLVYLVLRRLHSLVRAACKRRVMWSELEPLVDSLESIMSAVDNRVNDLRAVFQHANLDDTIQFTKFAFGMFLRHVPTGHNLFDRVHQHQFRVGNTIWHYRPHDPCNDDLDNDDVVRLAAESFDEESTFSAVPITPNIPAHDLPEGVNPLVLETMAGSWVGHLVSKRSKSVGSLIDLRLSIGCPLPELYLPEDSSWISVPEDTAKGHTLPGCSPHLLKVSGTAEGLEGLGKVEGFYRPCSENHGDLTFWLTWPSSVFKFKLFLSDTSGKLEGEWWTVDVDFAYDTYLYDDSETHDIGSGSATFSRTPARLYRHYPRQEEFDAKGRFKALWSYACNAIRDEVRRRISPRLWIVQNAVEANDFTKLQYRRELATDYSGVEPLTPKELSRLRDYHLRFLPQGARFVKTKLVADSIFQQQNSKCYVCDSCKLLISAQRSTCVDCILPDWSDTLDLCPGCIDKQPISLRNLAQAHSKSHTLLKRTTALQNCDYAYYIPRAQQTAKQTKGALGEKVSSKTTNPSTPDMLCKYCKKIVEMPFWVCLDCYYATYICNSCDAEETKRQLPLPAHLEVTVVEKGKFERQCSNHTHIRIADMSTEQKQPDPLAHFREVVGQRMDKMEQQMIKMKERTTTMEASLAKLLAHFQVTGPPLNPGP